MAKPTSATGHALMGLLSLARMSGYDLAQTVERSVSHFWPISKTQVYNELGRLEQLGFVRGTAVAQLHAPDKTVFELTADGERALDAWLDADGGDRVRLRSPMLVKLLLGHRVDPSRSVRRLERFREACLARGAALNKLAAELERNPDAIYGWAVTRYGVKVNEAIVEWIDEVVPRLDRKVDIDPRRPDPAKARDLLRSVAQDG